VNAEMPRAYLPLPPLPHALEAPSHLSRLCLLAWNCPGNDSLSLCDALYCTLLGTAFYCSFAFCWNALAGREIIPVGPPVINMRAILAAKAAKGGAPPPQVRTVVEETPAVAPEVPAVTAEAPAVTIEAPAVTEAAAIAPSVETAVETAATTSA